MAKDNAPKVRTIDPAAIQVLERADKLGYSTAFSRAAKMQPCPIGESGACCSVCDMGPCRLVAPKGQPLPTGICGATIDTVTARNVARHVAAGAAAHSDHGRDMMFTLLAIAEGEAPGYEIRDPSKLKTIAAYYGVKTAGRSINELAKDVAELGLADFGRQKGELLYVARAPEKRQEIWRTLD
ncbi:MAG: hypothetical protein L0Y55_08645, partial [Anaerolineales bacterium]|nr:hypothetical protein [Anaerolineales bacterium]